jgi:hypothetical protein
MEDANGGGANVSTLEKAKPISRYNEVRNDPNPTVDLPRGQHLLRNS